MSFVDAPAGKLHVDDGGSGSALPVLLVHGLGGDSTHWSAQLRHLRRSRRAVALDLRGHGKSELRAGCPVSIQAMADDVLAVADSLRLQRFVLAGFSIGGSVAGCVAGRAPQRVAGLFLVDPASAFNRRPQADVEAYLATLAAPYGKLRPSIEEILEGARPAVRAKVLADFDAVPRERSAALMGSMAAYDATAPLEKYLRQGGLARAVLSARSRDNPWRVSAQVPGIEESVVDDTSHWVMMDAPDEVQPILDAFLRRLEAK